MNNLDHNCTLEMSPQQHNNVQGYIERWGMERRSSPLLSNSFLFFFIFFFFFNRRQFRVNSKAGRLITSPLCLEVSCQTFSGSPPGHHILHKKIYFCQFYFKIIFLFYLFQYYFASNVSYCNKNFRRQKRKFPNRQIFGLVF